MTTFKNNAKYAELIFTYLDVAFREDTPLTVKHVLNTFIWMFKGGSLKAASDGTALKPMVSDHIYPDGLSADVATQWPDGLEARALRQILRYRRRTGRLRPRAVMSRLATYGVLTSGYGTCIEPVKIYTGMKAIYALFGIIWEWAKGVKGNAAWETLRIYTQEMAIGMGTVSRMDVPTVAARTSDYWKLVGMSRLQGLLEAVRQIKELIRTAGSAQARNLARMEGRRLKHVWDAQCGEGMYHKGTLVDWGHETRSLRCALGPGVMRVAQETALWGTGPVRLALGKSDMERLHQVVMSSASALVGVCAQAAVGTRAQKERTVKAVEVAEANIERIIVSARSVPVGDEVLVCKGYRRAYTAHLATLAGPLCKSEREVLIREAEETTEPGVLDVYGFMRDLARLDAASSLNAGKMFKICPAPDVSPGGAMIDRIKQIGDGNKMDPSIQEEFARELRDQILRAYIRKSGVRLDLKDANSKPDWWAAYMKREFDKIPSSEIDEYLEWEQTLEMPDVSAYDPSNWKDSGLGADTIYEADNVDNLGRKANMITRLIFDDNCPMPGREVISTDRVIKFFIKAEGHKDPARGIFSANLSDRQAQSWMERAVDQVAREHPSFMIGQPVEDRNQKVALLTQRPRGTMWVPLYYSFDISGWSAKMPAEPQRISHGIWARLYRSELFRRAHQLNEGAHIYLNMDGYHGWFKNTHANLEGFNGKEMTMVLVALLSLSVRRWRAKMVSEGLMDRRIADVVVALLFAYIDDGLSRIELPKDQAERGFAMYKETVIETFAMCGFTVEVSKCFPSDRFAIFLNEVYLAGRHVVHGVRAAMGISAEPTERHTSLVERVSSVSSGVRGSVIAGLNPLSASFLMSYHIMLHLEEWVTERDAVVLSAWTLAPRAWGGLGIPNLMQLFATGSGSAFEEGVATMQAYARQNQTVKRLFLALCRTKLEHRQATGVLVAPLSGRVSEGYMVDSRKSVEVRKALQRNLRDCKLSRYASRLLRYANTDAFQSYADAIVAMDPAEVIQEQMLDNLADAHPHAVFSGFARRLEKATTLSNIVGMAHFVTMIKNNRREAVESVAVMKRRLY